MTKGHFVSVLGTTLVDNQNPNGIPWRGYDRLRSHVIAWAHVRQERSRSPGLEGGEPKSHGHYARKKARLSAQRRAESLAAQFGATIKDSSTDLEVCAPNGSSFDGIHWLTFPYEIGAKVDAWCEVVGVLTKIKVHGWDTCEANCYCKES